MRVKPGVSLAGVRPETTVAMLIADQVFMEHGSELTLTSVTDGGHRMGSLHYEGLAFDGRTHDVPALDALLEALAERLRPAGFSVLLEDRGLPNEHVHVQAARRALDQRAA